MQNVISEFQFFPRDVCRILLSEQSFRGLFKKRRASIAYVFLEMQCFILGVFIPLVLLSICIHISCMFLTSESFLKQCVWLEMATPGPVFESEHSKQRDDQPGSHKCRPQCCDRLD